MPDIPPEDLSREIEKLWAKVAATESLEPVIPSSSSSPMGEGVAWEAFSLLKRQQRHQSRYWAELLESKEKALQTAYERQLILETDVKNLRQKLEESQAKSDAEGFEIQGHLQAVQKSISEDRARQEAEQASLKGLLDQVRQRLAGEISRFKKEQDDWVRREQQYLSDMKELQALSARYQEEAGKSEEGSRKLTQSLKEAKNALEKTLAELLRERQVHEQAEKERLEAVRKVEEVEKHLDELSKIWEEERAQWRELWERERSSWESQRQEFSAWEEGLRKEREEWHAELKSKEEAHLKFASQMTDFLRQSAEASTRLGVLLRSLGLKAGPQPSRAVRYTVRAAAAAVFLAAVLVPGWKYLTAPRFKILAVLTPTVENPTSLVYDGTVLVLSEWDGVIKTMDPKSGEAGASWRLSGIGAYRPVSLAFGGSFLWSLDSAQARILRHRAQSPERVLALSPAPGPAPTALSYDGESLWSYDAANKTLYRHGIDEGETRSFGLPGDVVPTAMAWVGGELWIYDSKTRSLAAFQFQESAFKLKGRYQLGETVLGLAYAPKGEGRAKRRLWILAGPKAERAGYALIHYAY